MNLNTVVFRLTANAEAIASLTRNLPEAQARWKPTPEEWSVLEVICHLYDEEREDFRQRVDYTLHRSGEQWPPINPGGWVTERGYNERDLNTMLDSFLREREASVTWLRTLSNPDWTVAHEHPAGRMTAGDVLDIRPTPIDGPLKVRARVKEIKGRKIVIASTMAAGGQTCARGEVVAVQMPDHLHSRFTYV